MPFRPKGGSRRGGSIYSRPASFFVLSLELEGIFHVFILSCINSAVSEEYILRLTDINHHWDINKTDNVAYGFNNPRAFTGRHWEMIPDGEGLKH